MTAVLRKGRDSDTGTGDLVKTEDDDGHVTRVMPTAQEMPRTSS